jgi:hypothetical protein
MAKKAEASMNSAVTCLKSILLLLSMFAALTFVPATLRAQGPPFQTDDPVPVDFQNYEFYIFGAVSSAPTEIDPVAPAVEFNWGALPRVQLHAVLPLSGIVPVHQGADADPSAYGLGDMELGVKVAFLLQTKYLPQIGTFPMFEIPTGNYAKGLGVGKTWYKLPLWMQKEIGPWTLDGGAGYVINTQDGFGNYPYGGFLLKRKFGERWELAAEVFAHGGEGRGVPYSRRATFLDAGGYYHFKTKGLQLLFAYGHSIAGEMENYAYLGLYKTWGKEKDSDDGGAENAMQSAHPH